MGGWVSGRVGSQLCVTRASRPGGRVTKPYHQAWQLTFALKKAKPEMACHQLGPALRYCIYVICHVYALVVERHCARGRGRVGGWWWVGEWGSTCMCPWPGAAGGMGGGSRPTKLGPPTPTARPPTLVAVVWPDAHAQQELAAWLRRVDVRERQPQLVCTGRVRAGGLDEGVGGWGGGVQPPQ